MRTRCPVCDTVFRVTSEQLRLKAGKVRCGQCQSVFNAFDHLVPEAAPLPEIAPVQATPMPVPATAVELPSIAAVLPETPPELPTLPQDSTPIEDVPFPPPVVDSPSLPGPESEPLVVAAVDPQVFENPEPPPVDAESVPVPIEPDEAPPVFEQAVDPDLVETPEESTEAARAAGLVAVRELPETGSYNRWAAGTLAGGMGGFESEPPRRAGWLFALVAVVLCLGLLAQLLFHLRTDVVRKFPAVAGLYEMLAVDVPLPRQSELVAIDTSDLQSDNARGLFVLQATLHNRAPYAQAWPALELTLTDTLDAVVARRVLNPVDYLPPATDAKAFPANGEVAVKLWLEARDIGAAGYRLYVFYP